MLTPMVDQAREARGNQLLPSANSRTHLVIAWPTAAIGAFIFGLAALTGLLIVVTSSQVLTTVAIVLAIIAFVVQIIVFIVQMQTSGAQALHAQELHGQLQGLLAQIQERTAGTQESLQGMNATLLEAALGRSLPQSEKASPKDDEAFVRDLAERTVQALRETDGTQATTLAAVPGTPVAARPQMRRRRRLRPAPEWPMRPRTNEDRTALVSASVWPTADETTETLNAISQLDGQAISRLIRLGEDDERSLTAGNAETLPVPGYGKAGSDDTLIAAGLAAPSGYLSASGREITSLTDKGRVASRLIFLPDPVPPGLRSENLTHLRAALDTEGT